MQHLMSGNPEATSISAENRRILMDEAARAETTGRLTARQLDIIHEAGWFRMFVPGECGGLQLPIPEALLLEESLAAIDGSLGWTVTLCSGAGLFAGFAGPDLLDAMFRNPRLCVGGSGAATGTAERVGDSFVVNGDWHFATGAPHLTAFSTNCRIIQNGKPVLDEAGKEAIRSFLFLPDEVQWRENWNVMGLRATASHSFRIRNVRVPGWRSFLIRPAAASSPDPVCQYPFLQFAELTLAANFAGMGRSFLDCFAANLASHGGSESRNTLRTAALRQAESELARLRDTFHLTAGRSWAAMLSEGTIAPSLLREISAASRNLASGVRRIVSELFPYAGIAAADPQSRMNRVWRDLFTATQHSLLTYPPEE